jgi:O-antigen/teichoic acid export membrane protein
MNLVSNILTTLLARIIVLGLTLLSSILLARTLGPEGRGLFALVLLLPELVSNFALLGFHEANTIYAGLEPKTRQTLVWHSVVLAGIVGGLIAILGIYFITLGTPWSQALVRGPLWLYLLPLSLIPCRLIADYWGAILRGMNRIFLLNVVEVGRKLVSLTLIVAFVGWLQLDVAGAVWADSVVNVGMVIFMLTLLTYVGVWGKPSFDKALWKSTSRFAFPAYFCSILGYLNYRIDQFIVAALLAPEQLGFYVIAIDLAERLWILTGAVANALLPHLTNTRERDLTLPAVLSRHVLLWTGMACLLVFAFADILVRNLYSTEFSEVVAPLRWILPGIFTFVLGKILMAELVARKKMYAILRLMVVGTTVNIVGNLVMVPRMGIAGAALASSISYSLVSFIATWYYLRETSVPWTTLLPRWSDLLTYAAFHLRSTKISPLRSSISGSTRQ